MDTRSIPESGITGGGDIRRQQSAENLVSERRDEIERVGDRMFLVPSRTRDHRYTVDTRLESCTCLDSQRGGYVCTHVRAAKIVETADEIRYEIRERHNSRMGEIEYRLVELRGDEILRTVSVSWDRTNARLDQMEAEGMVVA